MPIADRLTKARMRVRTSRSMTWRSPAKVAEPVLPASHNVVTPLARQKWSAAHVVRVDEDVGMDVDQPRGHQEPLRADRAVRLARGKRRRDRDDLAAADPDIDHSAQPGAR